MQKIEDLISWAIKNEKNCKISAAEWEPDSVEFEMYIDEAEKNSVVAQILSDVIFKDMEKGEKNMKKLFISQPMKDKSNEEIKAAREAVIKEVTELLGEEVEAIDSFFENAPHDARPLWFLGKSLELLSTADYVYFADNWKEYRGCRIEHQSALEYGINIIHE